MEKRDSLFCTFCQKVHPVLLRVEVAPAIVKGVVFHYRRVDFFCETAKKAFETQEQFNDNEDRAHEALQRALKKLYRQGR